MSIDGKPFNKYLVSKGIQKTKKDKIKSNEKLDNSNVPLLNNKSKFAPF